MEEDQRRVRLKIDLDARTIELDAPASEFEAAIAKTKELAGALALGRPSASPAVAERVAPASVETPLSQKARQRPTAPRSSSARPGRIGSFEPIRDLITEEQHKSLHAFMGEKAPLEQADQVLVAAYKGLELLSRQGFSYNEIYTLLWRAGVDPLPKAIDVVIQRLVQEQRMDKNDEGFYVKFLGRQRVEKDLPMAG